MTLWIVVFAPLVLLAVTLPFVRRAWRYTLVAALAAPTILALIVFVPATLYYRPTFEAVNGLSPWLGSAIAGAMSFGGVAAWAALAATLAYVPMERLALVLSRSALLAVSGVAGAIVGALIALALLATLQGGRVDPLLLGLCMPFAFVGACCGFMLPRFVAGATA